MGVNGWETKRWLRCAPGLVVVSSLALQVGCAAGNSPFASASDVEKRFVAAAITWDLSRDGDVTCDEWKRYATELFDEADEDNNGFLNRAEFAAMARRDRLFETAGFAYLDLQKDGRVARAELVDRSNPAFALMDADKDCVLTREERASPRAKTSTLGSVTASPPVLRRYI